MESFDRPKPLSAGERKVDEYVSRIKNGESKESIFDGLPDAFKLSIEAKLSEQTIDDACRLSEVKDRLGLPTEAPRPEPRSLTSPEERSRLSGWPASYELARIAAQESVDLTKLSREEYAAYAVNHSLVIEDSQLRASPWERTQTSVEEMMRARKEKRATLDPEADRVYAAFSQEVIQRAQSNDRQISERIRVRQGTGRSNSWLFFGINASLPENISEVHKSYFSFKNLNAISPDRFIHFMEALRDAGYNGDVKIFQDLADQGAFLSDQVVMHGASKKDAELALRVAEQFYGEELDQKSSGKDEVIDGEMRSYSQILASKIREAINKKRTS